MTEFVKICPKCGTPNPEYENLCAECGQFIGMEPATPRPQTSPPAAPAEAPAAPPPAAPERPTPAAATAAERAFFYLEPAFDHEILTVRENAILGQAHAQSEAEVQIPGRIEGAAFLHRRHCRFEHRNHGWQVQVLDQSRYGREFTNPTRVNGEEVMPGDSRRLDDGDELRLSGLGFRVRIL